jgi:hypothetical protein
MSKENNKYNIHLKLKNIGPHTNLNQNIDAGENGPLRIAIYATNGSGKTSISKQFRLLNIKKESLPDSDNFITLGQSEAVFDFKLYNQNNTAEKYPFNIKHRLTEKPITTNTSNLIFHTFNSDYVKQSIEPVNYGQNSEIQGYIIGKAEIDLSKEKNELEIIKKEYKENNEILENKLDEIKKELQGLGINSKTKDFIEISFENLISTSYLVDEEASFEELKKLLKKLQNIPEDLPDVSVHKEFNIDLIKSKSILNDLTETVSLSKISQEFKAKIQPKKAFVEMGLNFINENENQCPFCEQKLYDIQLDLINSYNTFINDYETKFKTRLEEHLFYLKQLKKEFNLKISEFSFIENNFIKLKDYFPSFESIHLNIFSSSNDLFQKLEWFEIEEIINSKINNPQIDLTTNLISKVELFFDKIIEIKSLIDEYIVENNKKIDKLNHLKNSSNNEVLLIKRRICKSKFKQLKKDFGEKIKKEKTLRDSELEKTKLIEIKESQSKTSKKEIVSNNFESLIKFIFSDKYIFDKDASILKYKEFSLKNNIHDVLSDGEKNIISFCYYIAEANVFINKQSDYDKLFFIIDDPISSMDFHYTYSVCRVLERINDYFPDMNKNKIKFILFTHSLEFMSILLRNNVVQKKYVLTPNKISELKKELVMPYHEHLSDIYKVANGISEPIHTTPNSMRHILETISKFENPSIRLISFIEQNDILKDCSSLHSMMQDLSHGIIRIDKPILPDEMKMGCITILSYINNKYSGQIENLKKTI